MTFLEIIPHAILNSIVLLGVLWMLYQLLISSFVIKASKLFVIATSIQFFATICFLINVFFVNTFNFFFVRSFNLIAFPKFNVAQISNNFFPLSGNVLSILGIIYFVALIALVFRMFIQLTKLYSIKATSDFTVSEEWKKLLNDIPFELSAKISIGTSPLVESPIVFGYFEPIILLPISICTYLSVQDIKFILVHELAHILRNDFLVNLFTVIAKIILWFNPFNYLIDKEIQLQRELACDAFVLQHTNAPIAYSKALFQLAYQSNAQSFNFSLGAIQSQNELRYRIQILNKIKPNLNKLNLIPMLFVTVLLSTLFFIPLDKPLNKHTPIIYTSNKAQLNHNSSIQYLASIKQTTPKTMLKKPSLGTIKQLSKQPITSKFKNAEIVSPMNNNVDVNYVALLDETKKWIKAHESPVQFVDYNEANDSIENIMAERLLMGSIIKSYLLKKALLEKSLEQAKDKNEAADYLLNSKEWADMVQYEKWTHEFLQRHQ